MVNRGEEKVRVHMNVVPRSSRNRNGGTFFFSSSASLYQYFQMFHMNFKLRFSHLVLSEMIYFEKMFKEDAKKFAIPCQLSWYKAFVLLLLELLVDSFR